MIIEKPLYPQRVTCSCAFWAREIIAPYFFLNEAGAAVSVIGLRYPSMINNFLCQKLEDMDVDNVYLQKYGAKCHTNDETISILREKFPGRVISRNGDDNWPLKSCGLIPVDFLLWGYVKDKDFSEAPQSIQELKEKIRAIIDEVELQMYENVMENVIKRA